jgi:hypothetical protein
MFSSEGNMICIRLFKNLLAGMLLTGMLAPEISFARGGGGGGHFEGGGHGGIAHAGRGEYYHGGGWRHSDHGYGDYTPFDYGLGDYTYPYDDNDDSFDAQPLQSDGESATLIESVQKELARLGYYHGAIDGVADLETENAIRWFQSVDHLPVTGQIDGQTLQALGIA